MVVVGVGVVVVMVEEIEQLRDETMSYKHTILITGAYGSFFVCPSTILDPLVLVVGMKAVFVMDFTEAQ